MNLVDGTEVINLREEKAHCPWEVGAEPQGKGGNLQLSVARGQRPVEWGKQRG